MFKFLFGKTVRTDYYTQSSSGDVISEVRNWYNDRYIKVVLQRNFLAIICAALTIGSLVGIVFIKNLAKEKTIRPFVLQIDDVTGETNVVNPLVSSEIMANESLHTYFVVKYLKSREEFDKSTYQKNYRDVVRLFSSNSVYSDFSAYIRADNSPINTYGDQGYISVMIRSVSFLEQGKTAQVRFRKKFSSSGTINSNFEDKIATIDFGFIPMSLNDEERYLNPVGFMVYKYRVDNEIFYDTK